MGFKRLTFGGSERRGHEKCAEHFNHFAERNLINSEASFPDEGIPLGLLGIVLRKSVIQGCWRIEWERRLSPLKRGMNSLTQ